MAIPPPRTGFQGLELPPWDSRGPLTFFDVDAEHCNIGCPVTLFCKQRHTAAVKMMQVKDILALKHLKPRPPVLVIDESTVKASEDTGPVCGCDEKYSQIKHYKPFLPGAVNPYNRRNIPDGEDFEVMWRRVRIGSCGLVFDRPVAVHQSELPEDFTPTAAAEDPEEEMFVRQPKYTEGYLLQKLGQCEREHSEGCGCSGKQQLRQ